MRDRIMLGRIRIAIAQRAANFLKFRDELTMEA